MLNKKLSIVIPCFNEEENIKRTYQRVTGIVTKIFRNYEIIFIENGSTDKSIDILRKLVDKDSHLLVLSLSRNFGPYGAYAGGLAYSKGDAVVCIDCDLQDPPELIPEMVKKWQERYDVVYGIRSRRKGNVLRSALVKFYYRVLNKLSYIRIPLYAGDFALMDRKVVALLNAMPERNKYFTGLRAWVGFKQLGIEYERSDRKFGKTKFSMIDYFRWGFNSIASFSYKPLELISYLTIFVVFLVIVGIFIYFLDFFFYPNNPRGFITLILVTLFLGGIQLLSLSIIAQYLANIFEETKNRPNFIVKEVLRKN